MSAAMPRRARRQTPACASPTPPSSRPTGKDAGLGTARGRGRGAPAVGHRPRRALSGALRHLRHPGRGLAQVGPGRQRVCRLRRRPRRPAAGPRPAGGARRDPGGAAGRHPSGRQSRARGPLGRDRARAPCRARSACASPRPAPRRPTWRSASPGRIPASTGSCASRPLPRLARPHDLGLRLALRRRADGWRPARACGPGGAAAAGRRSGKHGRRSRPTTTSRR